MPRKVVQGPIRDKEKTKQKLLAAVGKILRTKGYSGLKVSKIAAVAGFDKKLIYEYFGSTEKLIDEYIRSQDYWSKMNQDNIHVDFSDGGKELSKVAILNQFEHIKKNKELQKIILWGLSESKPILKKVADEREEMGEMLFTNIVDPHFKDKATMILVKRPDFPVIDPSENTGQDSEYNVIFSNDKGVQEFQASVDLWFTLKRDVLFYGTK
jgi:AcrR family transcriptional regulator